MIRHVFACKMRLSDSALRAQFSLRWVGQALKSDRRSIFEFRVSRRRRRNGHSTRPPPSRHHPSQTNKVLHPLSASKPLPPHNLLQTRRRPANSPSSPRLSTHPLVPPHPRPRNRPQPLRKTPFQSLSTVSESVFSVTECEDREIPSCEA
jgi:hypothetical protein